MRRLTLIVVVVIGILVGLATAVAYYAVTGEHNDPAKTVTVPIGPGTG